MPDYTVKYIIRQVILNKIRSDSVTMLYQLMEADRFVVKTLASKVNVARKPIALLAFIMVCFLV
jgi:hypothetical protein